MLRRDVVPFQREWTDAGAVPRSAYRAAGAVGLIGLSVPEEHGGGGAPFSYNCVVTEQVAYALASFGSLRVHMDVVLPYIYRLGTPEQRDRWLPALLTGERMASIAMTEPATGSDLAGIRTSLKRGAHGWVLNGSKTFITGGTQSDLIIVVARSGSDGDRRRGLALAVVEPGMAGFTRGTAQRKLGLHSQDTCDLFFEDVRVPDENILGDVGRAFDYLSENLAQERLSIAVNSQAQSVAALDVTIAHVRDRDVFGKPLATFQNTRFVLAGLAARISAGQAMLDRAIRRHDRAELHPSEAAQVKLFTTELHGEVVDSCLQLFGGYGYMQDHPIGRLYADARVARIYGGTSEIMKTIIAKSIGL
ncbi:acyl-CoA dehydrogenase [Microbacterium sp. Root61]|nr:acyl-CoA dehydrogenase [Microbacterium sp. Root61]